MASKTKPRVRESEALVKSASLVSGRMKLSLEREPSLLLRYHLVVLVRVRTAARSGT
jgi:hypothetical protein